MTLVGNEFVTALVVASNITKSPYCTVLETVTVPFVATTIEAAVNVADALAPVDTLNDPAVNIAAAVAPVDTLNEPAVSVAVAVAPVTLGAAWRDSVKVTLVALRVRAAWKAAESAFSASRRSGGSTTLRRL